MCNDVDLIVVLQSKGKKKLNKSVRAHKNVHNGNIHMGKYLKWKKSCLST